MTDYRLVAEPRTVTGKKVRQLRAQGYVPAVLYGAEVEAMNLQIARRDLEIVLRDAGTTNLISVQVGQEGDAHTVVVRDVDYEVVHRTVQHVDFMQIVAGSKITTEVSIVLIGETELIGTVLQDLNSLQIECLPSELISLIEVDISALALPGDIITVKDLQVPDSVTILADDDQLVVHSEAYREEEEEEVEPTFEIGEVGLVSDESDGAVED